MLKTLEGVNLNFSLLWYMKDFLTTNQRLAYVTIHKKCKDKKKADRIKSILMLDKGFSYNEIAELLLLDDITIRRWYEIYKLDGIKSLLKYYFVGGVGKLEIQQEQELCVHLENKIYLTAKEIVAYVEGKYGVKYSPKGMTKLLHRLGFSYKKPKHIPGKANELAQLEFIDKYNQLKADKGTDDKIYFMDGVHPLHNSQPAFGWIKKGKEQTLKTNTGRQRININGAYDIENHKAIIREDESINAQSTIALLKQMLEEQPLGMLYIILDNARYYRSNLVQEFILKNDRVKFMFLPPYSPNLNIIERLWKIFKKKTTYNEYYEKFSVFKEKCMGFFENLDQYKTELESLMTDNFQIIQA
jgi:transposase